MPAPSKFLLDIHKLAYLRDAVEAGPAKHVIKGISHSAGSYEKAIECLRQRYDKPRFIHMKGVHLFRHQLGHSKEEEDLRCVASFSL